MLGVCLIPTLYGQTDDSAPAATATATATATAEATGAAETMQSLDSLLRQLTDASLGEAAALIPQLEAQGGRDVLPLFTAMLANELVFDPATRQLYVRTETGDNIVVRDVFTAEPAAQSLDIETLERIRLNNRLRGLLRDGIARISLFDGDTNEREAAALNLLGDLNEDNLALLRDALAIEENNAVRELIEVGIAMNMLAMESTQQQRVEAVAVLRGRLENPVRNLLTSLQDPAGRNEQDPVVLEAIDEALASIETRIQFFRFVEELFYGLSLGSVLLLAAIGLAVTFGVMGVINMAHGEMLMLGAYTTYVVQMMMPNFINYSLWVAIPAAFMVSALVGILIQRYVIRYLNGRPLETLLATFGISLILQQLVRTIFSPLNRLVVSPEWMSGTLQINPVLSFTNNRLYILIFSLLVFVALLLILKKTSLGLQVRAVSQNRNMAKAMGIRTDWVDAMTFGLGSGIAGIAGVALSQLTNVGPNLGQAYIIDSFMVVVFGGVGNLFGTLVGAFTLGVSNKFLEPVTGAVLAKIITLVFIILFIQFRPKGLFPQKGRAAE
ncbi:MAG: urea ABC transporter permease subunit UrtB [Gammaproteobacteria bacterium]|nr:urea ABC transporter permease subunit UrtB [Gammaproteobacteria bacterium]